jgi:YD repeat-containing protein
MRKIVSIVTMLFFVGVVYSQKSIEDFNGWMQEDLNGSVKSVVSAVYNLTDSFGEIKKGDFKGGVELKFDQFGNYLECIYFDSVWIITDSIKADYDWRNYQVSLTSIEYLNSGKSDKSHQIGWRDYKVFKFNDDWNCIEKTYYKEDGKVSRKTINKYNDLGQLIEEIDVFDGELSSRTTYEYDNNGNLLEEKTFNDKGVIRRSFAYDNDNNKIKGCFSSYILSESCLYTEYNEIGNPVLESNSEQTKFTSYQYDKNNVLKKVYHYDAIDTTETSLYNERGQMIEKVWFRENVKHKITKKYNERGDLVFLELDPPESWENIESFSSPDIRILYSIKDRENVFNSFYEFEYDELGNCIQEIVYINFMPKYIVEREFEYFE